jgi:tRNA-dihydrouridine synthase A
LFRVPTAQKADVVHAMVNYCEREIAKGNALKNITRHLLGFYQGMNGAKAWRRTLSDPNLLAKNDPRILLQAMPRGWGDDKRPYT